MVVDLDIAKPENSGVLELRRDWVQRSLAWVVYLCFVPSVETKARPRPRSLLTRTVELLSTTYSSTLTLN